MPGFDRILLYRIICKCAFDSCIIIIDGSGIQRGIKMKIKCEFCENMYDDTLENCPTSGAKNEYVRQSAPNQPVTIEQLKEWYEEKGLPPYEVTRFFIGENYRKPKAFGIYKDENTGNFIVYKNKDTGERAIRYEGTDEAYAVNELLMRMRQEILNQKENNLPQNDSKGRETLSGGSGYSRETMKRNKRIDSFATIGVLAIIILISFCVNSVKSYKNAISDPGYYRYNDRTYYHIGNYSNSNWIEYAGDEWKDVSDGEVLKVLSDAHKVKKYYVSENDYSSLECTDATDTMMYQDYQYGYSVQYGYYSYGDDVYYHDNSYSEDGWYKYDSDTDGWEYIEADYAPEELRHQALAFDYSFLPDWDTETQFSEFTSWAEDNREIYDSHSYNSSTWDSSDSWSSSTWDSSDSWSSWSSDDSWDSWSSSDSWDSGSTDWGSDW